MPQAVRLHTTWGDSPVARRVVDSARNRRLRSAGGAAGGRTACASTPAGLLLAPGGLERVRAAVRHGSLSVRPSLVDALVEGIRVRRREHIVPELGLPNGRHRPDGAFAQGQLGRPSGFEPPLPP